MKVMLATGIEAPWSRQPLDDVLACVRRDRVGVHEIVTDPEVADLILFVDAHQYPSDWAMRMLRRNPLVLEFPQKAFVYDERDVPRDLLPGIFVSMPRRRFDPARQRPFAYCRPGNDLRHLREREPDLLFSFRGRRSGGARDDVLRLRHPRAVLEDTSQQAFFGDASSLSGARDEYLDLIARSKFVLCPRGAATASLRLFEVLAAGRVPVILSDDWVRPAGVDWDACSLTVPEGDSDLVGARIEGAEVEWPVLSAAARHAYDEWFAPEVWFHRAIELCREILESGGTGVARQWTQLETWRAASRHARMRLAERAR